MSSPPADRPPALISEDDQLGAELAGRLAAAGHALSLAVTDLVSPRPAYWRRYAPPVEVDAERRRRQDVGRSWHRRVAEALPDEGAFEVRVRRRGVIGRIDLLADVPVEIKSGAAFSADELRAQRPEYLEQLAVYCALVDRTDGRVVHLAPADSEGVVVSAFDVAFEQGDALARAVEARLAQLRTAILERTPTALPRCRWFGRGCEFEAAGACDCTGEEAAASSDLLERAVAIERRPDIEARWQPRLAKVPDVSGDRPLARFRDAIYPRRAYFERVGPAPTGEPVESRPVAIGPDLYDRLQDAIEGGPVGDVARLADVGPGADEEVAGFRGRPYLVRTSRAWARIRPGEASERYPQYLWELGYRCAATGTDEGHVIVAFEHAETDADRLQVLRYRFPEVEQFGARWRERVAAVERAISTADPGSLPPCPDWMFEGCPYRASCGCGGSGRSHR